jgi:hypothetical protein
MRAIKRRVVLGLEAACRATRFIEWIPGWRRIYPWCFVARWSSRLDYRWGTGCWPVHDEEGWQAWEVWFENLSEEERHQGHWHAW